MLRSGGDDAFAGRCSTQMSTKSRTSRMAGADDGRSSLPDPPPPKLLHVT